MSNSTEMLRIRCTKENMQEFKVYAAHYGTYNKALETLLADSKKLDIVRSQKIKS